MVSAKRSFAIQFAALALIATFVAGVASLAAEPPGAKALSAESLLKGALEYLEKIPSSQVDVAFQIVGQGAKPAIDIPATLWIMSPDKFRLAVDGDRLQLTLIANGKQFIAYLPALNRYTVEDIESGQQSDGLVDKSYFSAFIPFKADRTYDQLIKFVKSSESIGIENVDGVDCHHCRFNTGSSAIDVWIEVGDRPLVRRLAPFRDETPIQLADRRQAVRPMRLEWNARFNHWNTDAKLTDADFAFTPPEGAEQVESFAGDGAEPIHPLVGKPAPAFAAPDLQGNTVSLADAIGKNVIVLDFWATWCGPCVAALPQVSEVTKSFADRGVVFYAVNVGEDRQTVIDFLETSKAKLPELTVVLDDDHSIADKYGVSGIPQSVLIGKDGRVQVVHIGFGPSLKPELTEELEQLVAGKDLAAATLQAAAEAKAARPADRKSSAARPESTRGAAAERPAPPVPLIGQ